MSRETKTILSFLRVRPLSQLEISEGETNILQLQDNICKCNEDCFEFEKIFEEDSTQENIYDAIVRPVLDEILNGFSHTILTYGQRGCGKTYTLFGRETVELASENIHTGLIPRTFEQLFDKLEGLQYEVWIWYLELYNDTLYDLIRTGEIIPIKLYEDPSNEGSFIISGINLVQVKNIQDVFDCLSLGNERKQVEVTKLNYESSRSHTIFSLQFYITSQSSNEMVVHSGKLNFVDLASSENYNKMLLREEVSAKQRRESVSINNSLFALRKCINAISMNHNHVPYRDSKLTQILKGTISGNAKTSIIANVSPASCMVMETLRTLKCAVKARSIKKTTTLYQPLLIKKDSSVPVCAIQDNVDTLDDTVQDTLHEEVPQSVNGDYKEQSAFNQLKNEFDTLIETLKYNNTITIRDTRRLLLFIKESIKKQEGIKEKWFKEVNHTSDMIVKMQNIIKSADCTDVCTAAKELGPRSINSNAIIKTLHDARVLKYNFMNQVSETLEQFHQNCLTNKMILRSKRIDSVILRLDSLGQRMTNNLQTFVKKITTLENYVGSVKDDSHNQSYRFYNNMESLIKAMIKEISQARSLDSSHFSHINKAMNIVHGETKSVIHDLQVSILNIQCGLREAQESIKQGAEDSSKEEEYEGQKMLSDLKHVISTTHQDTKEKQNSFYLESPTISRLDCDSLIQKLEDLKITEDLHPDKQHVELVINTEGQKYSNQINKLVEKCSISFEHIETSINEEVIGLDVLTSFQNFAEELFSHGNLPSSLHENVLNVGKEESISVTCRENEVIQGETQSLEDEKASQPVGD